MTTHTETQLEEMLASRLSEFKTKMLEVADQALTAVHCELLPYVLSDTESNIAILVSSCLNNILEGKFEVVEKLGYTYITVQDANHYTHHVTGYSQSLHENAIQKIYDSASKEIENTRIKQLEAKVESLQQQLTGSYRQ